MSEKRYSVRKIVDYFRGKFSRNYVSRLVREMTKDGEISWCKSSPILESDAKKVIQRLLELGDDGKRRGFYFSNGYKYIKTPEDSYSKPKNGYIAEHRYVVEWNMARKLFKDEYVYHLNGIKDDNRRCNLLICKGLKKLREVKNSLFEILPELMQCGIVEYDFKTQKYEKLEVLLQMLQQKTGQISPDRVGEE